IRARFTIDEPSIRERIAIGIAGAFCAQRDAISIPNVDLRWMCESRDGRMVRFARLFHAPVHARGELVLIGAPPSKDRRVDGVVRLTIDADDLIDRIRPDWPRFGMKLPRAPMGRVVLVSSTPTAVARMLRRAESVRE